MKCGCVLSDGFSHSPVQTCPSISACRGHLVQTQCLAGRLSDQTSLLFRGRTQGTYLLEVGFIWSLSGAVLALVQCASRLKLSLYAFRWQWLLFNVKHLLNVCWSVWLPVCVTDSRTGLCVRLYLAHTLTASLYSISVYRPQCWHIGQ